MKEVVIDTNERAKFELFFVGTNEDRFKNLRLVLDYLSFAGMVSNTDKRFLYLPGLYYYEHIESYAILNTVGFDALKMVKLIFDENTLRELDDLACMKKNNVSLVSYGGSLKSVLNNKGIDANDVLGVSHFIS